MNIQTDPLADLKAEIEAEEAANAETAFKAESEAKAAEQAPEQAEETEQAGDAETQPEETPEEVKAREETDSVKKRINDANAARRIAEKRAAALEIELAKAKGGNGTEETPAKEETREERDDRIWAEARAHAFAEMEITSFAQAGSVTFGEEEFEAACNEVADVGGNVKVIQAAIAAMDTPDLAARAIWQLSQQEPAEIERILKLNPLRQATVLAKLATARAKKDEEPVPKPVQKKPGAAPSKPIQPINAGSKQPSREITEEMSDADFDNVWRSDPRLGGPLRQ